ncbi:unnamed protein product [Miscanthus lutarioriparius]|uniref:Uncharacterized protein n=1 Tax=Miscanthus lutarioriparius TaxID=422564 RepID=A0A811QZR2_9POAL|nr:unnamed protein product [Miscanthus lutarioriparius]
MKWPTNYSPQDRNELHVRLFPPTLAYRDSCERQRGAGGGARAGAAVAASQPGARASVSRGSAGGARQLERRDRVQQEAIGQGSTARESCGSGAGHRVPVNRGSVAARAGFSKPQASNGAGEQQNRAQRVNAQTPSARLSLSLSLSLRRPQTG